MPDKTTAVACSKVNYLPSHLCRNPHDPRLLCPEYTQTVAQLPHTHYTVLSWSVVRLFTIRNWEKLFDQGIGHNGICSQTCKYAPFRPEKTRKRLIGRLPKTIREVLCVLSNVLFTIKVKPFSTFSSSWKLKIYIICGTLLHRTTSAHCQQPL